MADRYEFGNNWKTFLKSKSLQRRVEVSKNCLLTLLKAEDLKGKVFMDVGCGSGLSSLAAIQCGAEKVIAWDYDIHSVEAAMSLRERYGVSKEQWSIMQGDALSEDFMKSLPQADIVYSWGVLHHTGNVWKALELIDIPLKSNGTLALALYSVDWIFQPEFWLDIKQKYNQAGPVRRFFMECWCFHHDYFSFRHPLDSLKKLQSKYKQRGMSVWCDIRDWLGGWPMEYIHDQEVIRFFEKKGYILSNFMAGEANTEFCFKRK